MYIHMLFFGGVLLLSCRNSILFNGRPVGRLAGGYNSVASRASGFQVFDKLGSQVDWAVLVNLWRPFKFIQGVTNRNGLERVNGDILFEGAKWKVEKVDRTIDANTVLASIEIGVVHAHVTEYKGRHLDDLNDCVVDPPPPHPCVLLLSEATNGEQTVNTVPKGVIFYTP